MIDCGEGTQMQLLRYRIKHRNISQIFISHLHGDHYLGLIGLISSMHLVKRSDDLWIYGPRELAEVIRLNLKVSQTQLNYKLHFVEIPNKGGEIIYEDPSLTVETIAMNHRIQCTGFLFREKPKKRKVLAAKLPQESDWKIARTLKNGENVFDDEGNLLYGFEEYTYIPKSYSFAHCSDTLSTKEILPQINGVDLLYHEATFLHEDLDKAVETFHSTARQAAEIANQAKVNKLIIGHFSSRYRDLVPLLEEARTVFENTVLAVEGETTVLSAVQTSSEEKSIVSNFDDDLSS